MKINKSYLLIVLFLCGLSAGNVFAADASAAAAAGAATPAAGYLGEELVNAVRRGYKAEVERLIAAGADVNGTDSLGIPAWWTAAWQGKADILKLLLDAGAEAYVNTVNTVGKEGHTILIHAAHRYADIVDLLLQVEGIEMNAQNYKGWTALMCAAFSGRADIVKLLLNAGADKTIQNMHGETAEDVARTFRNPGIADIIRDYVPSGRLTKSAVKTGTEDE